MPKKIIITALTVLAVAAGMFLPALFTLITDSQSATEYYDMTMLDLPIETDDAEPGITGEDVIRAFKCCGDFHDVIDMRRDSMTLSAEQAAAEAETFIKMLYDNDALNLEYPEELSLVRTRCFAYIASAKDAWGEKITSIRDIYAPAWLCVFFCYGKMIYVVVDDYIGKVISIFSESESPKGKDYDSEYERLIDCFIDYYKEQEIKCVADGYSMNKINDDLIKSTYGLIMYGGSKSVKNVTIITYITNGDISFNINAVLADYMNIEYAVGAAEEKIADLGKTPGA